MAAEILDIADAVVTELNAETFSIPFTAERLYIPQFDLTDLSTLHVSVIAETMAETTIQLKKFKINVLIMEQLDSLDVAEIDPLVALVTEIADFLQGLRPSEAPGTALVLANPDPLYDHDQLEQSRLFMATVSIDATSSPEFTITYRRTLYAYDPTTGIPALATTTSAFTRTVGSFITDGFAIGNKVEARGLPDSANNGVFTVTAVTATVLTVSATLIASAAGKQRTIGRVTDYTVRSSPPIDFTTKDMGTGAAETTVQREDFSLSIGAADLPVTPDIKTDSVIVDGETFRVIAIKFDAITETLKLACLK